MPYVPGSTLKGMFRTALIADEIQKCPEKYERTGRRYSLLPQNAQAGNNALQERQNV
ncbi:MAG: RAMP superfamily CRISPR-associated protein [Roseburia sp.]